MTDTKLGTAAGRRTNSLLRVRCCHQPGHLHIFFDRSLRQALWRLRGVEIGFRGDIGVVEQTLAPNFLGSYWKLANDTRRSRRTVKQQVEHVFFHIFV